MWRGECESDQPNPSYDGLVTVLKRIRPPVASGAAPSRRRRRTVVVGPHNPESDRSCSTDNEETRDKRISIAREAEHQFDRKVAWGVVVVGRRELFTHVAVPVMTRLRQPERLILDTLVDAGVARSRSEALAWCVRLVGQHSDDWLTDRREAMSHVADVRTRGPAA